MAALLTSEIPQEQTNLESVRMVVLARSVKCGQYCVAGKRIVAPDESGLQDWSLGEWIRPVTRFDGGDDAVPSQAFKCAPLSKIRIDLGPAGGIVSQPENRLWSQSNRVRSLGVSNRQKLSVMAGLFDEPETIWHDPGMGASNRVSQDFETAHSLQLVRVQELVVYLQNNTMGRERIYAKFIYNGRSYSGFTVTDRRVWEYVQQLRNNRAFTGETKLPHGDDYWITFSLTKPFGPAGARYKMAAAFL